jgi:nucleotide-binding universal stress UspA family protein
MRIRKILVPIDFSPESLAAAGVAVDLAQQLGARVDLVTILDAGDLRAALKARLNGFKTDPEVQRALQAWIETQVARLRFPEDVRWAHTVRRGMVEPEILKAIQDGKADLVVMGSRGLSRRIALGSKTVAIVRRSSVPVLVVKKQPGTRSAR